ncbi:ribosomal protein L17 [Lipomyces japonicus]|uniref:mitochondrial 54S ribosomal protein bL17m n=1 Tax=Lipomyces japonicus TaxID=56871 RepID=UPI0034CE3021
MPSQGQVHRTLGRSSAHRRALLRNLVSSVIEHESITTTYARAKEAQPLVEQLITSAKYGNSQGRSKIYGFVFKPEVTMARLYDELAPRYQTRTGGFTRLLHLEPRSYDAAPMAVLELIDGPKDLRFYLTAKAIARAQVEGLKLDRATQFNKKKIEKDEGRAEALTQKVELFKQVFFTGEGKDIELLRLSSENGAKHTA